jgi:hypothetical protein
MRARNGTKFKRCGGVVVVQVAVLSGRQEEISHAGGDIGTYSV